MKLSKQIMIFLWCSVVLVLVITIITSSVLMTNSYFNQKVDVLQQKTNLIENNIGVKMQEIINVSDFVRQNIDMELLDSEEYKVKTIKNVLGDAIEGQSSINNIIITDKNFDLVTSYYPIKLENYQSIFDDASELKREDSFSVPNNLPYFPYGKDDYITYSSLVRDNESYDKYYYIFINFKKITIFPLIWEEETENFEEVYIFNSNNEVIFQGNGITEAELMSAKEAVSGTTSGNVKHNSKVYFFDKIDNYSDYVLVTAIDENNLISEIYSIIAVLIILGCVLCIVVYVISKKISKKITSPIRDLEQTMKNFMDGDMNARVEVGGAKELNSLIVGYNMMADKLVENVDELIRKHEEIQKAEVEAVKFKYELLQNQINPHFLYNTLNTVSYLAMENKTDDIRSLIYSLNILLRAVINVEEETVTLKREFEFLKSYVNIQNYRFDNPVILDYDLPKQLENIKILKLLLQPLIENSIIHGILPKDTNKGRILIKVLDLGECIEIIVVDNGIGMDEEETARLNAMMGNKGFNRIGISNISERIKMVYGSQLKISGYKNVGTLVYFQIKKDDEVK